MFSVLEKKDLITFLNRETPSIEVNGVDYTFHFAEKTKLSFGDLDTKCVLIEFVSSKIVKHIDLKNVTTILTQRINELINKDLFTIFSTHNFGDRIFLYVDFNNFVKDTVVNNDGQSAEKDLLETDQEAAFVETKNSYDELKLKLRDNVIFERVRNFLWLSSKPFSYPDFLWESSLVNLKIQIGLDGFNMDDHSLKGLFVEFCCELGCTRDQIDAEFSLRMKSKALNDIIHLNQVSDAAKYPKFKNYIESQIKTLENTIMYT